MLSSCARGDRSQAIGFAQSVVSAASEGDAAPGAHPSLGRPRTQSPKHGDLCRRSEPHLGPKTLHGSCRRSRAITALGARCRRRPSWMRYATKMRWWCNPPDPAPTSQQSTSVRPLLCMVEALLLVQQCRDSGARSVHLVLPYMMNARSDRGKGEQWRVLCRLRPLGGSVGPGPRRPGHHHHPPQ